MKELQAIAPALREPGNLPAVLATLVGVQGSSYRRPGARMLVMASGLRIGGLSGGCLEEDLMVRAARVRASGIPEVAVYDTTTENDLVWGVGTGCHGVIRVLLERISAPPGWALQLTTNTAGHQPTELSVRYGTPDCSAWGTALAADMLPALETGVFRQMVSPPTTLLILGAGDDSPPLARIARELGWRVIVADPRPALATAIRFPMADNIVVGPPERLVELSDPPGDALVVIMTHHYVHDVPILRALLARPLGYLGLLGPRKRAEKILSDLEAGGLNITPALRARLHAPVGLDLGAEAPEQVALAIVAEMLAVLHGRDARPLRERTRPIHE